MDFNEYQQLANRTLYGNEQVLTNCALGLASECGEVIDTLRNYTFQGHDLNHEELTRELGDVLWYVSQIAHWADISFEEVANQNIDKLRHKYPEEHKDN